MNLPEVRLTPASLSLRAFSHTASRLVELASTQHMQHSIQGSATHTGKETRQNIHMQKYKLLPSFLIGPLKYIWAL